MALATDSTALATKEVPDKGDKADNVLAIQFIRGSVLMIVHQQ